MRVLSLSQPWLWAILHTDPAIQKLVENRSWQPPIDEIGNRFALHAAKSMDKDAFTYFAKLGLTGYPQRYDLYPSSCIVGVATIDRVRSGSPEDLPRDLAPEQRKWFFGPFGWILRDVRALAVPIPWKGAQGFRHLPAEVALQIAAALDASHGAVADGLCEAGKHGIDHPNQPCDLCALGK